MPPAARSIQTEKLAGFTLATLPKPTRGLSIDLDKVFRGEKREEIEAKGDTIANEIETIRALIRKTGLPDEIMKHPIYAQFLLGDFPFTESEVTDETALIQIRNLMALIPLHPDINGVIEILKKAAEHVLKKMESEEESTPETLENAQKALVNGMLQILNGHLHILDEHPVLIRTTNEAPPQRMSRGRQAFKPKSQPKRLQGFSPKEVRNATRSILKILNPALEKAKENDEKKESLLQEACIQLMKELGLVDRSITPSEKTKILNDELPHAMSKARKLYKRVGKALASAQGTFGIKGAQVDSELVAENKYRTPIELLEILVTHSKDEASYESGDYVELNEAQAILGLAYQLFLIRRDDRYKAARAKESSFDRAIMEKFIGKHKEETVKVEIDERGNIIETPTGAEDAYYREEHLRILNVPEMPESLQQLRIFFDENRRKDSEALTIKMLLYPSFELGKDVLDFLGGRLFLWDLTLEEFLNSPEKEKIREGISALAIRAGKSMGLNFVHKDRTQLKPGEFCIKDKLEENLGNSKSDDFPAMKVYGRTKDGIPVEFQIVLRDGYNSIKSPDSPNSIQNYDLKKDLDLLKIIKPASIFPREHIVAKEIRAALEKRKTKWNKTHQTIK